MRLIDADELLKKYPFNKDTSKRKTDFEDGFNSAVDAAVIEIEDIQAMDAMLVVHGHWIEHPWNPAEWKYTCSRCGGGMDSKRIFCPDCSARMDEEENHETD